MNVLILGGTTEATQLARALAGDARFDATISLAGRTANPAPLPLPIRVGGFGGPQGLAAYLPARGVDALIDATHPFAAQMSRHAATAASSAGVPLLAIHRPAWAPVPGDRWDVVSSMEQAAAHLGATPRRVFLTVGQQELAPFGPPHHYLIRSVDRPATLPTGAEIITARGPFREEDEGRLLEQHAIEVLVTKNSGGAATRPKLDAARALGLPVIMVSRPPPPEGVAHVPDAQAALAWLEARHRTLRGA